jgi:hypothetical protein
MKIHMVLQGKGGAAKSTDAAFMAQFLLDRGKEIQCIDTDPVNASLCGYKALNVRPIQIMEDGDINQRAWDTLVEILCRSKTDVVVDNGATSFTSLLSYVDKNSSLKVVADFGHTVYIHIPIAGGDSLQYCLSGMTQIIETLKPQGTRFAIWLNPFLGPIERKGQHFEQFEEYIANKANIEALIHVPAFVPHETFGRDMAYLLATNLTLAEALMMEERPINDMEDTTEKISVHGFHIAVLQRYSIMQKRIFGLLAASGVFA